MGRDGWHRGAGAVAWRGPVGIGPALGTVLAAAQGEAKEERLVLPSGLAAYLHEVREEPGGERPLYRFRFVAPGFTGAAALETVTADLQYLCRTQAVPRVGGSEAAKVVISLADARSEFGQYDPGVTQVFEAYRIENGACIWEMF